MKAKIHPEYGTVVVSCASCGNEFLVGSTKLTGAKREYQGREYPSMTLEICSQCHPFFSGKQIYVDTAGRVEKFQRRYGSLTGQRQETGTAQEKESQKEQPETAAAAAPAEAKKSPAAGVKVAADAKAKRVEKE